MKNTLKTFAILFAFFLLTNCEKESFKTTEQIAEESFIPSHDTFRFSVTDLLDNDKTFSKLSREFLSDKLGDDGFNLKNASDDGLIITSDTINVIEEEGYKSYTIRVKRPEKNYDTENLIVEERDGEINAFILGYRFEYSWLQEYRSGQSTKPRGKLYYTPYKTSLLKSGGSWQYVWVLVTIPCGCGHYGACRIATGSTCGPPQYATTQLVSTRVWVESNGSESEADLYTHGNEGISGAGGGGQSSPGNNSSQSQANLEDTTEFDEFNTTKINLDSIYDEYPCQKGIVTLINAHKTELASFILSAFGGNQTDINLTYTVDDIDDEFTDGTTQGSYNSSNHTLDISITLDLDKMSQSTDLYIAAIAVHENVHAILKYIAYANHFNIENPDNASLGELAEAYAIWKRDNQPADKGETEHYYMAELIDKMAEAIKGFGESQNYNLSNTYYENLSWSGGVNFTPSFDKLSIHRKAEIRATFDNERNKADTKGKGKKCN